MRKSRKKRSKRQQPQPALSTAKPEEPREGQGAVSEDAPEATVPTEETIPEAAPTRRRFFRQAWWALGGIALLEYVWVVISFLRPRGAPEGETGIVVAGPVAGFEPGTVTAFRRGKFYLSRLEDGGFLALSRECTHLGCTVPWDDEQGRFVCPCHASAYDQRGVVLDPPAPRPLDLFPIRIENGVVKVDTGDPQKRLTFDEAQVTEP
ncbi:MAG: Rieske (2Fe-2S) protein [Gemmatimonadetes bacterium]|uniref:Rieske (2Fe-2S) protein n=1 Tax=Candidatus Kutchimonas denitrificans TaxID=3056748 RepID=A0AAE4Z9Y9_9BACT|nr:Rieske (2Fe-2S) protein [Gemmatimonadota bacterium]NIR75402.1 Rieske (2Fe-2S) protein [Candidatus Kutchimonas denitrificans]NIS01716.1 Rieske (2Fe-2S) protein [Gemmatimonadota bacterium]NIT67498.1 Rieske (2Fe-2S) protein [Gemmatimonadota bacterium]NIU53361.1 Rieske 2Fe-2S domain-containing protein [Gemmatimonadota bacterium]